MQCEGPFDNSSTDPFKHLARNFWASMVGMGATRTSLDAEKFLKIVERVWLASR